MNKTYDYQIIGAGLSGATCARLLAEKGKRVLVCEKLDRVAGNLYDQRINNINVHMHGPHCFHTSNIDVWNFVNRFSTFFPYSYHVFAKINQKSPSGICRGHSIYPLPFTLALFSQLWGCNTPQEAERKLKEVRTHIEEPSNFVEAALNRVGEEVYFKFLHGYTYKQWGRDPETLGVEIAERLPVRLSWNTEYHSDVYIGIPYSYTDFILNLLDHPDIEVQLEASHIDGIATIATCSIDEFYHYRFGPLEYRSLIFKHEEKPYSVQGCPQLNYVEYDIPYTRTVEHKYFAREIPEHTVLSTEYPCEWKEGMTRYYPIGDEKNRKLYQKYREVSNNVVWAGRLGTYQYMNMDKIVEQAIQIVGKIV